jgi:hypothetical protein
VTKHGDYDYLQHSQAAHYPTPFTAIPDEEFEKAFARHLIGSSCEANLLQARHL